MALLTAGNVYYVSKAGNNTTGLSWKNAFTTITAAITASNATISWSGNNEDNYIIIAPGTYAETIASGVYYTTLIGLGTCGMGRVTIASAAGIALAGNSVGSRFYNIKFVGKGSGDIVDFGVFNDSIIENCQFVPDAGTLINALSFDDCKESIIRNNFFTTGSQGVNKCDYGMYFHGGANQYCHNTLIEGNKIIDVLENTGTGIYIHGDCNSQGAVIRKNIIRIRGAGTGIDDDAGGSGYQYAVVLENHIFTIAGTGFDVAEDYASMNIWNNGSTCVTYPLLKVKTT